MRIKDDKKIYSDGSFLMSHQPDRHLVACLCPADPDQSWRLARKGLAGLSSALTGNKSSILSRVLTEDELIGQLFDRGKSDLKTFQ
jgi:hypothetical protein